VGEGSVTVQQVHDHLSELSPTAPQHHARPRGIASA